MAVLAALVLCLVVVATLLIHSSGVHAYLLRTVQEKATAALNTPVQFRDFSFQLSGLNPSVDIYQVTVQGASPYRNPPLAQADQLHLAVTVASLLRRSWYVNEVRIEHPVVHVFADARGITNIPSSGTPSSPKSETNVFDLGIRHFLLQRGELYYNDRKSDLSADLQQLTFQSRFDVTNKRYSGTLAYHDGHVQVGDANPLPHSLDARFSATPQELVLDNTELRTGNSRVALSAKVTDYSNPKLQGEYKALVDAGELRRSLRNENLPEGKLQLKGDFSYASEGSRPLLDVAVVNGEASSEVLTFNNGNVRVSTQNLEAKYSLSHGNATLSGLHARLLGGRLAGTVSMRDLAGATKSQLSASLQQISTAQLQKTLAPGAKPQAGIEGIVNATASANWGKSMEDLMARADASVQSGVQSVHGGAATPVNGVFHARYRGRTQELSIENSFLRAPQTSLTMNGTVSKNSALQVELQTNQFHTLEDLAMAFRPTDATPIGLYGRASLTAKVQGSTSNPRISAQLAANELRVRGSSWKSLRANLYATPSELRVAQGELEPTGQGRIHFELAASLREWKFEDSSKFRASLNASRVSAADLAKAAGLNTPVTGTLTADITASGTQLAPAGHGTAELSQARVGSEPLRAANLKFAGNGSAVTANLQVDLPSAGSATAMVQYEPKQQAYKTNLRAVGIKLDQLETFKARNLQVAGVLNATASGQGTLRDPQMQVQLEVPQLNIRDQVIKGFKFQGTAANHTANFTVDSQVIQSYVRARGAIALSGEYNADVSMDTQAIPFAPLLAAYWPSQAANLSGQTELHATLRGPLKNRNRLEAHVVVPQLSLNYQKTIQIAAASPIHADFTNGVLEVQRSTIRGTDTEINFQARVPTAKDAPIALYIRGGLDLRLAQLISPDITSGGQLQFDIDSFGSRTDPNVQGQVRIINASFANADTPVGLQQGNGLLTLTRDRMNVTQFHGKVGGGDVSASGGVIYRPELRFDLGLTGKGIRILYAQSVRTSLSPNLSLSGNFSNAILQGNVGIEELSFTENFDLMDLTNQFGGEATPPPVEGFTQDLRLQIGITTPGGLNLTSRTLSIAGNANLQVHGTAAQPVLLGRVNLSSGDLIFSGNRYILQGGTIDFRNPARTEPVLDMAVNTTIDQYDIQMRFWGPADHLHTNYASDPPLPPADVVNLVAFGKTSEAAAANPTPSGSLGAESLVASQASSQVTNRIEKLAGISQLSIDPVLGDGQQSAGARVAIQHRVTGKVFVTFSSDVTGTQKQLIKVEYRMNGRTSFDAVRDQNGGFSFQTSLRKQW
jgi:translocation and assembly module TamB